MFKWPCNKRTAHGPHQAPCTFDICPDQVLDCEDDTHPCPGVKAHPATMIGGRQLP